MKTAYFIIASIIALTLSAAPVFAAAYAPNPIVSSGGAPALAPALGENKMSGILAVKYVSNQGHVPLVLQNDQVTFLLCGTGGCVNVVADLSRTGSGTYAYTFSVPPSPTGSVTITLPAGGLFDEYGRAFPSVDTRIGSYSQTAPSVSSTPPSVSSTPPSVSSQPVSSPETTPHVYREAAPLASHNSESESYTTQTGVGSIVLTLLAFSLVILPRRR
jgi:hypothetical protein